MAQNNFLTPNAFAAKTVSEAFRALGKAIEKTFEFKTDEWKKLGNELEEEQKQEKQIEEIPVIRKLKI